MSLVSFKDICDPAPLMGLKESLLDENLIGGSLISYSAFMTQALFSISLLAGGAGIGLKGFLQRNFRKAAKGIGMGAVGLMMLTGVIAAVKIKEPCFSAGLSNFKTSSMNDLHLD